MPNNRQETQMTNYTLPENKDDIDRTLSEISIKMNDQFGVLSKGIHNLLASLDKTKYDKIDCVTLVVWLASTRNNIHKLIVFGKSLSSITDARVYRGLIHDTHATLLAIDYGVKVLLKFLDSEEIITDQQYDSINDASFDESVKYWYGSETNMIIGTLMQQIKTYLTTA